MKKFVVLLCVRTTETLEMEEVDVMGCLLNKWEVSLGGKGMSSDEKCETLSVLSGRNHKHIFLCEIIWQTLAITQSCLLLCLMC